MIKSMRNSVTNTDFENLVCPMVIPVPDRFEKFLRGFRTILFMFMMANVIIVNRYNVPLTDSHPPMTFPVLPEMYRDILLVTSTLPDFRQHLESGSGVPWSLGVPVPKVIARTSVIEQVNIGGHDVQTNPGTSVKRTVSEQLLIAHLPFTSQERFTQKVKNLKKVLIEYSSGFYAFRHLFYATLGFTLS